MAPEDIAKPDTEHAHQSALFAWAALPEQRERWPELALMYAVLNRGERNPIVAARLKAEGFNSAVPHVCLPVARGGYFGLYIEMKKPDRRDYKKDSASDEWLEFVTALQKQNYSAFVCHDWQEAVSRVALYISLPPTLMNYAPIDNEYDFDRPPKREADSEPWIDYKIKHELDGSVGVADCADHCRYAESLAP